MSNNQSNEKYFAANISGWINTQVFKGETEEKAYDKVLKMVTDEKEITYFSEISSSEYNQIKSSY